MLPPLFPIIKILPFFVYLVCSEFGNLLSLGDNFFFFVFVSCIIILFYSKVILKKILLFLI